MKDTIFWGFIFFLGLIIYFISRVGRELTESVGRELAQISDRSNNGSH
jgi:hypothetical protein